MAQREERTYSDNDAAARRTPPGRGAGVKEAVALGDNMAEPLLDARVLSFQRNSAGDRHGELRNAVSELVESLSGGRPSHFLVVLQVHEGTCSAPFGASFQIRAAHWITHHGPCATRI